ncbi:MAG: formate dehydrogenase subunit alpha [Planctomycetes bacterium]|nr:formate dehydrogenase subunit alpha [Planctomycetota bacterium]
MPEQVQLTIDGRLVTVAAGTTVWEAARAAGIDIPVLCHQPRLRPVGVCRLCVVDVGARVLAASCVRACEEDMEVQTTSPRIERSRRVLLELLLADHPSPCARERTTGDCELEALARRYGLLDRRYEQGPTRPIDDSSRVIAVDHNACILCDRCIRACDEIQSNEVIGRVDRGGAARIAFDLDQPMGQSTCVSCGECAASCPTGALTNKPLARRTGESGLLPLVPRSQTTAVDSVCPYCGVGCALTYHVRDNRILWADGRDSPGNEGRLCVKGRYGWDYALHEQRLTRPLIRRAEFYPKGPLSRDVRGTPSPPTPLPPGERGERQKTPLPRSGGEGRNGIVDYAEVLPAFREASWDEALDRIASRLKAIKQAHGSAALAGFGSAKCSNEEAYLFQKLIRAALGTNNVDHCTRLCHASSVAALLEGIGSGSVTDVFGDARLADVILLTGSNTTANHPVAATFFKEATRCGTKLIVVDPRRPDIANFAAFYCRTNPGTDVAFYNAVMHVLVTEGLCNEDFIRDRTENFEALRDLVVDYSPERMAPVCGIDAETIRAVARTIGGARAMMTFWGMGISQHTHGTDNARCLIALCLLTGNVGQPGTGLHPLRGQNNVQGASDAGLIPMYYPDYQKVGDPAVRAKFEAAWGVPLDPAPGLTVVEIMAGALEGCIRGMFMMGENPFLSDPNINKVRKALSKLEFLAVQDIFLTETAEFADVVLPASSFLEKTGTYTNTDRRVQIGRNALVPPGEARLDWQVLCELSTRLGYPMDYTSPEEVFAEFASLTKSYAGLTYANLGTTGKLWPCPDPDHSEGTKVLFAERFPTPTGRGRFVPCAFQTAKELPDGDYPLVLNTGRLLEHWHTGTMTRRAQALDALQPGPFVEVHPDDLGRYGLADGATVTVRSRRGAIRLEARASRAVTPGSVFIPFHFREAAANVLTIDELDPYGKIPEFKFCAVRLEK